MPSPPVKLEIDLLPSPAYLIALLLSLVTILPAPAGAQTQDRDSSEASNKTGEQQNPALAPALEKRDAAKTLHDQAKYSASLPLYREALTLAPRAKFPKTWARMQMDFGFALSLAASVESGNGDFAEGDRLLEEAVTAYRSAQEVFTKETDPTEWVDAQVFIGYALVGRMQPKAGYDSDAAGIAAIREIVQFLKPDSHPKEWAKAQSHLGRLLYYQAASAKRKIAEPLLAEALTVLEAALEVITRESMPEEWGGIQTQIGEVYSLRSKHGTPTEKMENLKVAEKYFLTALEVLDAKDPHFSITAKYELSRARSRMSSLKKSNP